MDSTQDGEKWKALVNMTMNHHVPYNVREFPNLLLMKDSAEWAHFVYYIVN